MYVQRQLADASVELAELDQALDDVLGLLHETEAELLHADSVLDNSNNSELFIAKLQVGLLTYYCALTKRQFLQHALQFLH